MQKINQMVYSIVFLVLGATIYMAQAVTIEGAASKNLLHHLINKRALSSFLTRFHFSVQHTNSIL
jgi:hypothetical protein